MSEPPMVMKRYELKYLLSAAQTEYLLQRLKGRMCPDRYGRTSIASLYYDTPSCRLIRASIEKPEFKEKLRLRSYGLAAGDSPVYLELKRKAYGIVYKRRARCSIPEAERFLSGGDSLADRGQIGRELACFRDRFGPLAPKCLILYDREAYFEPDGDLRLTVDFCPRYRFDRLDLTSSLDGEPLRPAGETILEIKVQEAVPLWLSRILDEGRIYRGSFSKYGEAYLRQLAPAAGALPAKRTVLLPTRTLIPAARAV